MVNPVHSTKQHLAESLWLACGARGMQVSTNQVNRTIINRVYFNPFETVISQNSLVHSILLKILELA